MAITPALRNADWLLNTDTGLIFVQNGAIAPVPSLVAYKPTDEEMLLGRQIKKELVIEPAPVVTEVVTEPETLEQAEAAAPAEAEFVPEPEPPLPPGVKRGPGRPRKE